MERREIVQTLKPAAFAMTGVLSVALMSEAAGADTYIVESGDTLSEIAYDNAISVEDIVKLNDSVVDPDLIYEGQHLELTSTDNYEVQPNDTLSEIAQKEGVSVQVLTDTNPTIKNPDVIISGQIIDIPKASTVGPRSERAASGLVENNNQESVRIMPESAPKSIELTSPDAVAPFSWPIADKSVHPVSSCYNDDRDGGVRGHGGVDFSVAEGTPVEAPQAGRIVYDRWAGGYGNLTIIEHDDLEVNGKKLTTIYGHNRAESPYKEGDKVEKGQVFQYTGNTGSGSGPHLHFAVYAGVESGSVPSSKSSIALNPLNFIYDIDDRDLGDCVVGDVGDTVNPWLGDVKRTPTMIQSNSLKTNKQELIVKEPKQKVESKKYTNEALLAMSDSEYIEQVMGGPDTHKLSDGTEIIVPASLQRWGHYRFVQENGNPESIMQDIYSVVESESAFDEDVVAPSNDIGYFQINGIHFGEGGIGSLLGYTHEDMKQASANIDVAAALFERGKGFVYPSDWPARCAPHCDPEFARSVIGKTSFGWRDWYPSAAKHQRI